MSTNVCNKWHVRCWSMSSIFTAWPFMQSNRRLWVWADYKTLMAAPSHWSHRNTRPVELTLDLLSGCLCYSMRLLASSWCFTLLSVNCIDLTHISNSRERLQYLDSRIALLIWNCMQKDAELSCTRISSILQLLQDHRISRWQWQRCAPHVSLLYLHHIICFIDLVLTKAL